MESHEARLLDEVVVELHQRARVHTSGADDAKGPAYAHGLRDAADYLTLTLNEIRRGMRSPS
jgi:hypothetical protein